MTPHLSGSIAFRLSIASIFVLCALCSSAQAQPAQAAKATSVTGVYNGTCASDQGPMKFKLSLTLQDRGSLVGEFTLYVAPGADQKAYTCDVKGRFIATNRMVQLIRGGWKSPPPVGLDMSAMNGVFDPAGAKGAGQISGTMRGGLAPKFEAIRDVDETAKMLNEAAGNKDAGAPAPRPPNTIIPRTEIDGMYVGTYGSNPDDKVPAKLYVKFIDDGSVNGKLDGVFTFDVPPSAGAKPITYTYKLTGYYGGSLVFYSVKPLGKPAPDAYALQQISAEFDRTPLVTGRNGQLEFTYIREQISAKMVGRNGLPGKNKFEGKWDKDASAKLDTLMAAAQRGAENPAGATALAQAPNSPSSSAQAPESTGQTGASKQSASSQIDSVMAAVRGYNAHAPVARPSLVGVFNGTYTRANEPPTKFKLTITHPAQAPDIEGVATIYLPVGSGTKAYTYSLRGAIDFNGAFHLLANEWDTIPPKDFKDFKSMGFNGEFRSNVNQNTARILSLPTANLAAFVIPQFEAAWDAKESADIKGTIAAQKSVGDADLAAALKARDEVLKNAKPMQLASKDLVRKSEAYWDVYRNDFIREVFDGGFADDVDKDPAFQIMFINYVDEFSKNCAAYFPGAHQTVTITTTTTSRPPGGAFNTTVTTKTVEVDSRFIPKYIEFSGVDPAPGSEQEKEQTAKTFAIAGRILNAAGPSHGTSPADANALLRLMAAHGPMGGGGIDKFFATEVKATGPSAALRQMGENLLRGATGQPSLQQSGGKIEGAQAETDKNLPPGRFTHLIDAANSFYRDPANARLKGRFQTAFDETLATKFHGVMTREEEYYYANDYGPRFRNQIMQPRALSTDAAWPRLHPVVEKCVADIGQ